MEKIVSKASTRNSEADVRELRDDELKHVSGGRTIPNGRTDVIKVMGNTKWGDIELNRS
jgi:bacteriocin-like protein